MIENDNVPTTPRPIPQADSAATIQVPAAQAAATVPVPTPQTHPFMGIDDLLELQIVSEPQISPDGSLIAFTLQRNHGEPNTTSSAIWMVRPQGGKTDATWQVTSGEKHDTTPCWSPNGDTLAFLSDRSGTSQLYLLPMHGGEARQLSNLPNSITEYTWRSDGSALLAHSPWKPDDDQDVPDTSSIAVVYTRLDEQWDGMDYKQGRHQQPWLIPIDGTPTRLISEPVDILQSCWSPDGTEIAFCANRRPDPDLSASMALWILTVATGQMRRLTPEEGLAQMPSWSPDGQYIAYYYAPDQTETSNISLWIVNVHGDSTPRPATSSSQNFTCLEIIVDELHITPSLLSRPQWYPDSRSIVITVQERGQIHLYCLDREHDSATKLTSGNGCYISPHISQDGQIITMIRTDWFTPGDIWSMDSNGENRHKLTGVNDPFLRSRQLVRPKRITWHEPEDLEIEGWLYLPPLAEGTKAPLILEVHGGPSLAWGDSYVHEFQILAGKGYAVLAANPRGSAGYGEAFCKVNVNDWGGADFHDLMAGIDYVTSTEPVDGTRLGIGGISYGGYMTNWAITQTNRFKAAVSRNGISYLPGFSIQTDQTIWFDHIMEGPGEDGEELRRSRSALPFANHITTPLLLLHAADDLRCPWNESLQLFVVLRKRGHTVELVRYPDMSHLMDFPNIGTPKQRIDRLRRTVEWFERFV